MTDLSTSSSSPINSYFQTFTKYAVEAGKTPYPSWLAGGALLASFPLCMIQKKGFPSFLHASCLALAHGGAGYMSLTDVENGSQTSAIASLTHLVLTIQRSTSLVPSTSNSVFARASNAGFSRPSILLHLIIGTNAIIQGLTWNTVSNTSRPMKFDNDKKL